MAIKIITDAGSNLFQSFLNEKKLDITVIPMELLIEDKKYICYADEINVEEFSKEFYLHMREGKKPRTTLVNPTIFSDYFEKEVNAGNEVVCVTLSSNISGTFQAARLSAMELNEKYDKEVVHVIDSKSAGFGEGRIAIKCAELAAQGLSFEEVVKQGEEYVEQVRSEFTVDDLKYLSTSGRIHKLVATVANILSIKPLLYGSPEGKIEVTAKAHGRIKAIKTLAKQVIDHIDHPTEQVVYISHCDVEEDAMKLKDLLVANGIPNVEIYFYDLITGAHVGPGTLAVFYEGKNREL